MLVRYILVTTVFSAIYFSGIAQKKKPNKCAVDFFAKIVTVKNTDEAAVYLSVKTTVTNNTPDTISYITKSCSWQQFYVVDTRYIKLTNDICDNDSTVLI